MNPSWVMVGIALGGMIFQAGIGWSYFSRFKALWISSTRFSASMLSAFREALLLHRPGCVPRRFSL